MIKTSNREVFTLVDGKISYKDAIKRRNYTQINDIEQVIQKIKATFQISRGKTQIMGEKNYSPFG